MAGLAISGMLWTTPPTRVGNFSLKVAGQKGRELNLAISGRIALENLSLFNEEVAALLARKAPGKLTVDLAGVEYLDSAGALGLLQLESESKARSVPLQFVNLSEKAKGIMGLIDPEALKIPPLIKERGSASLVEQLGEGSQRFAKDLVEVTIFLGALLISLMQALLHPRSVRWQDVAYYMKRAGADGLPIVGLLSFLLGLIIAFMSSLQLKQFGANIFVASLLAIGMVKELGPIMTAILVAGRSGSAFAAEIGTMKVNEEVDALVTMGFDPINFLATPQGPGSHSSGSPSHHLRRYLRDRRRPAGGGLGLGPDALRLPEGDPDQPGLVGYHP